jgi:hypothetical protein
VFFAAGRSTAMCNAVNDQIKTLFFIRDMFEVTRQHPTTSERSYKLPPQLGPTADAISPCLILGLASYCSLAGAQFHSLSLFVLMSIFNPFLLLRVVAYA